MYHLEVSGFLTAVASGGWVSKVSRTGPVFGIRVQMCLHTELFRDRTHCSEIPFGYVWIPSPIRTVMAHAQSSCYTVALFLTN
jgi:hypothetical protein